jgi:hypothetical protein
LSTNGRFWTPPGWPNSIAAERMILGDLSNEFAGQSFSDFVGFTRPSFNTLVPFEKGPESGAFPSASAPFKIDRNYMLLLECVRR